MSMMESVPGLSDGPPMTMPGPTGPMFRPSISLSDQLSTISERIAMKMRIGMEDLLREISAQGSPEAEVKILQLQIEKMQFIHNQEMAEMRQRMNDMKSSHERAVDNIKKQAEAEKQKAIKATQKKALCYKCRNDKILFNAENIIALKDLTRP